MTVMGKYQERLKSIPPPGGNGCHVALLGIANLGILAGLSPEEVFGNLRASVPQGKRAVTDREIADAINRAARDHEAGKEFSYMPKSDPIVNDGEAVLRKLVSSREGVTEADMWEASPVRIDWPPEEDALHILQTLYDEDDLLYIGERQALGVLGGTIRPCAEWIERLSQGGETAPYVMPNPLNGELVEKKGGDGPTLRGDGNVSTFRFCVVEFDNLSRNDQLRFWHSVDLPISALIDSAGKSIHGWLDVRRLADVSTLEAWDWHIKNRLYSQALMPLGVDSACSNPSRLSRLPGHLRADTQRQQRLLYLSPEGRRVP